MTFMQKGNSISVGRKLEKVNRLFVTFVPRINWGDDAYGFALVTYPFKGNVRSNEKYNINWSLTRSISLDLNS